MNTLQLTLAIRGAAPALLTLPQPLTAYALHDLEQAVAGTLGMLRRDLRNDSADGHAIQHQAQRDAGALEYASWLPDAAAIEYASWATPRRTALR